MVRVAIALVTLCAVIAVALYVHHERLRHELRAQRNQAVRAVQQGHYTEARPILRRYLHHTGMHDVEAMVHLARAITAEPSLNRADQVEAMRLLDYATGRNPRDLDARLELLELQTTLGFDEELLRTVEQVVELTDQPGVVQRALRRKAEALLRLERHDAALATAQSLVELQPEAVEAHRLVLEALAGADRPRTPLIRYARKQIAAQPGDVRPQVLLGCAQRLAGRSPEAVVTLNRAAEVPMPDAATARLLVEELEAVGRFDQALVVLERTMDQQGPPDHRLLRALVRRLWERGDEQGVLTHLAGLTPRRPIAAATEREPHQPDIDLLAIKFMALARTGRDAEAQPLLDALRDRADEPVAAAWAIYLGGVFDQPLDPAMRIERCRRALRHDATNPYIRFELGQALAARGQRYAAIAAWQETTRHSPAWLAPHLALADVLAELGWGAQAVEAAEAAHRRAPGDPTSQAALARARQLHMAQGGQDSPAALLELVTAVQHAAPYEPTTLPMHVALLAEVGRREDAGETLLAALDQPLAAATLIDLAEASRAHSLGLGAACYAQCEALHGRTPELAYARALDHWRRGRAERAWTELAPPSHLVGHTDDRLDAQRRPAVRLQWKLAQARFLDHIDSPDAAATWASLLDRHPASFRVHHAALEAQAVRNDRTLTRQAIDQLRALTPAHGLAWRLAEGQWLLDSPDASHASLAKAARLLGEVRRAAPTLVAPRFDLARTFARLGEPAVAMAQLRVAVEQAPQHQPSILALARLHVEHGDAESARALLDRVVRNPTSTAPQLQQAAVMLIRLRGWDDAAAALTRTLEAGGSAPRDVFSLGLLEEPLDAEDVDATDTTPSSSLSPAAQP